MLLTSIKISNFRTITNLECPLDINLSLFLGENNVGKSSLLHALRLGLGSYGYHDSFLKSDFNQLNQPIELIFYFEEKSYAPWHDEVNHLFADQLEQSPKGLGYLCYQVVALYNPVYDNISLTRGYLKADGGPKSNKNIDAIMLYRPVIYLSNLRSSHDRRFTLQDHFKYFMKMNNISFDKLPTLDELNSLWLALLENAAFAAIATNWPSIKSVENIDRWSAGNQSMALIALFYQFIKQKINVDYGYHTSPILAIEEPEANLYPLTVRAMGKFFMAIEGQKLIITHSAELLSKIPLRSLRRLYQENDTLFLCYINDHYLNRRERLKLEYAIQNQRGRLFFAHTWLLVEGASEYILFPRLAEIMGYDFDLLGITCVEFSQTGVVPFVKAAIALNIGYILFTDNDDAGKLYRQKLKLTLNSNDLSKKIMHTGRIDLEHLFWEEGFRNIYEEAITNKQLVALQKIYDTDSANYADEVIHLAVNRLGKPTLVINLLLDLEQKGKEAIPPVLRQTIEMLYYRNMV